MKVKLKLRKQADKTRKAQWVDPYVSALKSREGIKRIQGSPTASIFLVSPIPGQDELRNDLPWCGMAAKRFFTWMQNEFDLYSNEDFLIMPATFDGDKAKKGNTDVGIELVEAASKRESIERFVVVGAEAFKTYFGYGKKPSMQSLAGKTLYLQQSGFKPVFVFPDLYGFQFDPDAKFATRKEWAMANFVCQRTMGDIERLVPAFKQFLKLKKA